MMLSNRPFIFVFCVIHFALMGCTAKQQDDWLRKTVEWNRDWIGLMPKAIQVDDIDFSFLEGGPLTASTPDSDLHQKSTQVLVMVHGYGASKDSWNLLSKELIGQYRLIQVDLPGHGATQTPEEFNYDLERQAMALYTFVKALRLDRFHLLGNSMGGAVGLLFAAKFPERLKSLILIDSAGVQAESKSPFEQALAKGENPLIVTDDASFQRMMELIMHDPPYIPWPYRPAIIRGSVSRIDLNKRIFADMMATKERLEGAESVRRLLSSIYTPTLILWGQQDQVLDVSSVQVFEQYLPYSRHRIFQNVGHVPMVEVPDQTALEVVQFVQTWR
jgi:abhydrolase domain-containing protein 6